MRLTRTARALTVAAAGAVLTLTAGVGAASAAPAPVDRDAANPGVLKYTNASGTHWVVLHTGNARTAGDTTKVSDSGANGPYRVVDRPLLTKRAPWQAAGQVWAPSMIQGPDGLYYVYYAAPVDRTGHPAVAEGARCIGVARGSDPLGPFDPADRALACFDGSGANAFDSIDREGGRTGNFSLIDATPSFVAGQYVLTYKTQYTNNRGATWHCTTRLLKLDPADLRRTVAHPQPGTTTQTARSLKISNHVGTIEENPVLVEHGGRFTLFTSFGNFGQTADTAYVTRYRQADRLWKANWLAKSPTRLALPAGTRGQGNAHVMKDDTGRWLIFFNGHDPDDASGQGVGPKWLYLGVLGWTAEGRPRLDHMVAPG